MANFEFRGVKLTLSEDGRTLVDPNAPGPNATAEEKLKYMRECPLWRELTEELIQLTNKNLLDQAYLTGAINALST